MSMREYTNEMYHIKGCNSSSLSKHDLGPYISNYTIINLLINLSFIIWGFFSHKHSRKFSMHQLLQCSNSYTTELAEQSPYLEQSHIWSCCLWGPEPDRAET